jgi:D-alanyl-D-alanine dipeptidase
VRDPIFTRIAFGALVVASLLPLPASARKAPANESDFVDVQSVDRTITIDLRYAGSNNVTRRPIYPPGTSALLRASVAQRLAVAQKYLKAKGYGLKIWDAYRPAATQQQLWQATHNRSFVADPSGGVGSMHTRGAAVDATLIDSSGSEVAMPTDFDNFTPAALITYQGGNPVVRSNLKLLQKAMAHAGFYGLRTEWWHFCAPDWKKYPSVSEVKITPKKKGWFL